MKPVVKSSEGITYESPTPDRRRFRVLVDPRMSGSRSVAAGQLILMPETSQPRAEAHTDTEEIYYCARGRGKLLLGGVKYLLEEGTAAYVGCGVEHQVFNDGDTDLLMVWFESPPSCEDGQYKPMKLGWSRF